MAKLNIRITYCQPCGHQPHAVQLANQLLGTYGLKFNRNMELTLVPVDQGEFDVFVNGTKIFSRYDSERMPTFEEIRQAIDQLLSQEK
ncbi:MAG: Rdx family protein [Armatimonadetes bacterium]|nr:Rdx family protein [Armatimonadota bacterium]MCX7968307.1 Rdx family protein [Armatimonadota bacterium]MDW8143996.1 Rdx family protein [Armatimonadota bacterium]